MTESHNTPPRHPTPEQTGNATPGAPVPPKADPASPMTEPVTSVNTGPPAPQPPAPQPGSGQPGYSARHSAESGSPDKSDQGKGDQAKGAAQDVAGDAQEAGRAVKDTAASEAADVKDDVVREAKRLGGEASSMLESQASDQLDRAAETVRSFSDDVGRMARGEKPEAGYAKDLADQLGSRADATATWLEDHDPREVLDEVQRFARRRPVAFLAIAAGVGFAAGRLTRGVQQNHAYGGGQSRSQKSGSSGNSTSGNSTSGNGGAGNSDSGNNAPGNSGSSNSGTRSAAGSAGAAAAPAAPAAPAPVSGTESHGAPAYETGPSSTTPGYTESTDPYAGGGGR
ncbi:hypothetical protein [Nesterenkonia lutea]|uniref:ElaB/YqjD/DUF883 family membrane-anchored ribosome-binding protein n=1 Tax=Nesterenkonia lutea TaxID=272919 RepID=A0ABR9JBY7_9MICC|nr:hypothetical protein [Nesterenkonia lutea]MBE1523428.1 ElaB/YqjD/DUF883 family membrane-anchored ribosome-binding protein [Nesterenkonia lutea]